MSTHGDWAPERMPPGEIGSLGLDYQPGVPPRGNRLGSSALRYSHRAQPSIQMLAFRIARARTHRLGDMGVGIAGPPKRELRLLGAPSTHGQTPVLTASARPRAACPPD